MRRRAALVLAAACLTSACASPPPAAAPPSPAAPRSERLAEVTAAVAAVDEAADTADPLVASVLTGVREVDLLVGRMRDPATVDTAKDEWPRVSSAVAAVDLAPVRPAIREIAFAVDEARAALAAAQADAPTDWEADYLAAEDRALVAMRDYAAAADALVQVVERHWPTYTAVAELTGAFVERRWLYRTSEEAAAAYEVELAPHLGDLARAQAEIASFRDARDDAAADVNAAAAEASRRFRERTRTDPSPSP